MLKLDSIPANVLSQYSTIMNIVNQKRFVKDRVSSLIDLGYDVRRITMGSGGVGQVRKKSFGFCIQISYGIGKYNFAYVVCI